jgi:transcriptional regulator with XRE-family HTH domain
MLNKTANSDESGLDPEGLDTAEVGTRVRQLRQMYGMSQRKLALLAGVTNGAISMIEQNRVSPSVASLKKVLTVFGLSLGDFFVEDFAPESKIFYRSGEMHQIASGPVDLRQVGRNMSHRKLQVLHEKYAPGGDTGPAMLSHDGEEAGVVVRGEIEITVGGQSSILGPGDGYYFKSRLPHRFRNVGEKDCEIISSCTPPTF